jgi:hypothetical protein
MNDQTNGAAPAAETLTEDEMKTLKNDASQLAYAAEAAAHPMDQLFGSLRERVAAARLRHEARVAAAQEKLEACDAAGHKGLDALDAGLAQEQERDAAHRTAHIQYAKAAMIALAKSERDSAAIQQETDREVATIDREIHEQATIVENVVAGAPTATNVVKEVMAQQNGAAQQAHEGTAKEPALAASENDPGPAPAWLAPDAEAPAQDPPRRVREDRRNGITDIRVVAIGALAFLVGAIAWSTQSASGGQRRHVHAPQAQATPRHEPPPATPVAAAIDQNPWGDPIWYAAKPIERIDQSFAALDTRSPR